MAHRARPEPFRGFAMPFSSNERGGVKVVEDSADVSGKRQTDKLLRIALGDNTSSNPFQDLPSSDGLIFRIKGEGTMGIALTQLKKAFATFADRLILRNIQQEDRDSQEIAVRIDYDYILTETQESVSVVET